MGAFLKDKKLMLFLGHKPVFKGFLNGEAVYSSEEYPFVDGVLADDLTLYGFTISDNTLHYHLSQGGDEGGQPNPKTEVIAIVGLDLTGYDYLEFTATASSNSYWGTETHCKYGIDTADDTLFSYTGYKDMDESPVSYSKIMDVSAYEGIHNLVFECQVHANTSHSGYSANMYLNVDSIKLHNE